MLDGCSDLLLNSLNLEFCIIHTEFMLFILLMLTLTSYNDFLLFLICSYA